MGYVYATELQLQQLKDRETALLMASNAINEYNKQRALAESIITEIKKNAAQFQAGAFHEVNLSLGSYAWPETNAIKQLSQKYPFFKAPVNVTKKILVSYTPQPSPGSGTGLTGQGGINDAEYNTIFNQNPAGGMGFISALNDARKIALESLQAEYNAKLKELKEYQEFLSKQDEKRDVTISSQGLSQAINSVNSAINAATSDPKKLAVYALLAFLVLLILFTLIKKFLS